MRFPDRGVRRLVLAPIAAFAVACSSVHAPPGSLPGMKGAAADPWGAWVNVVAADGEEVRGELIAIEADVVVVATSSGTTSVPRAGIRRVQVEAARHHSDVAQPSFGLARSVSKFELNRLAKYARFPKGLPPGLDPATLRPRPALRDSSS